MTPPETREELFDRAGVAAAATLGRNLGAVIPPDLMLEVRETPTGLCRLVLDLLGIAPGTTMTVVPEPRSPGEVLREYVLHGVPAEHAPRTRQVDTWRLRALEEPAG